MSVIKIKLDDRESIERKIMSVKVKNEEDTTEYHVPMPILGDQFYINGIIYKITYQRDNPFRISAEPTGAVVMSVIEELAKPKEVKEVANGKVESEAEPVNP